MDAVSNDARTFIQVHDGLPDHPKLADVDDVASFLLVALWCYCSRYSTDGRIPKALAHRMTKGATAARCAKLVKAGLLHDRGSEYEAHDYLKHQRSAAQIAAVRQRNASNGRAGGLAKAQRLASDSLDKLPSNLSSETASHAVAEVIGHRSELPPLPPPPPVGPPTETWPKRRPAQTALPDDWQPTAAMVQWARDRGWPDDAAKRQTERFREQAAATARRQADWTASWRTWLIGEEGKSGWQRTPTAATPTGSHEDWMVVR